MHIDYSYSVLFELVNLWISLWIVVNCIQASYSLRL